ncbi:hypothetical protein ST12_06220 [Clostridium botulinum]|uniref:ABC-three component system middle component 1 n=1 Tax=Clostridium botulinum TaxID=1491 RepID=UPI000174EAEE|nr:ABC-three component system middle component 1 [Clostridium botulinum]ACD52213.1 hypothetical protein CLH_1291 [Clostridium botulinum E3 str. Alaska E43]AJF29299.1 hypothetical protein ST13_06220 [Clostridium botulinum]AJF32360.1 hypothetical protein ST12_06220 [Clostridium botulinum]MBY6817250.1 hypothetical protein [Clostridium botulinum]MBY6826495.1 hypothetical protein [Clostridium botulinum]
MINIISDLFKLSEFAVDEKNSFASNNEKHIFYVYKSYNNINEFIENLVQDQDDLYDYISQLENGNEIKKNTSFIILIKLKEKNEKDIIQKEILDLEEDKYFFKKYVITYLSDEVESFYKKLEEYDNVMNFLKKSLNNAEKFEEFKVNNDISYYSLILKLYIKIPHLSCGDIFGQKEMISLKDNIIDEIEKMKDKDDTILDYHKKIISLQEKDMDSYIENMLLEIKESE